MGIQIRKATLARRRLRLAIAGHSKAGKSFTSLTIATGLLDYLKAHDGLTGNGRIGVIDTEHSSCNDYAGIFDFDMAELTDYDPAEYVKAILEFQRLGYEILVVDQISHAWAGRNGILEQHAHATKNSGKKNGFALWADYGAKNAALIEAFCAYPHHVIATMRAKVRYRLADGEVTKIGTRPIQRNEVEYEFTTMGQMDSAHNITFGGSRCREVDNRTFIAPDASLGAIFGQWVMEGRVTQDLNLSALHPNLVNEVKKLFVQTHLSPEQQVEVLVDRGVSRIEDLPTPKAQDLIRAMRSHLAQEERQKALAQRTNRESSIASLDQPPARSDSSGSVNAEPPGDVSPTGYANPTGYVAPTGTAEESPSALDTITPDSPADIGDALVGMLQTQPASPDAETLPDTREDREYRAKILAFELGYDVERWNAHLSGLPGADPTNPHVSQLSDETLALLTGQLELLTQEKEQGSVNPEAKEPAAVDPEAEERQPKEEGGAAAETSETVSDPVAEPPFEPSPEPVLDPKPTSEKPATEGKARPRRKAKA